MDEVHNMLDYGKMKEARKIWRVYMDINKSGIALIEECYVEKIREEC